MIVFFFLIFYSHFIRNENRDDKKKPLDPIFNLENSHLRERKKNCLRKNKINFERFKTSDHIENVVYINRSW